MKKNISINLQGLIFHIEEDGYELLGRYLAEVKAHFAPYRGHQDIVADIEGRIAELFAAHLSPTQQVITLEDVEAMIAKMGRVSDFDTEDEEELEVAGAASSSATSNASAGFGSTASSYTSPNTGPTAGAYTAEPDATEARRLYRDMAHRKVAGVCAGLAQYFRVNPLWFRIGFLGLLFIKPLIELLTFDTLHFKGDGPFGLAFLAYIVLWIALPKRFDAPTPVDTVMGSAGNPLAGRKLYRDTDTAKIGGVAAGLAAYFRVDVTLIRIILLVGLVGGGFTLFIYLILWAVLPVAKTLSEKMQMRGDVVNLAGFASNLNTSGDEPTTANRPIGTFLEDLGRSVRPLIDFIGSGIRVFAGVMLTLIGFSSLLALLVALSGGTGLIPNSNNVPFVFLNGIPAWGKLSGFLAMGIPALAMLLGGLNLLLRRRLLSRSASLSLLGLWLLSIIGVVFTVFQQIHEHEYQDEVEQVERYPALTTPVLYFDARYIDRDGDLRPSLRLVAADSTAPIEVRRIFSAKGPSQAEARRTATSSIEYTVRMSGDSSLIFDDAFSFLPNARYRDQDLSLTLRVPRNRTFRVSERFANLLGDDDFVGNRIPENVEEHRYRLRGNKLECIGCTVTELHDNDEDNDSDVHINIDNNDDDNANNESDDDDNDDDDNDNDGITLNYGGAPAFSTDLGSYGSSRRTFNADGNFERVRVQGGYRVVIRPGSAFKIDAAGQENTLDDVKIERNGDELDIRPRRQIGGLFGNWDSKDEKVLIRIEMPNLTDLSLAGAVKADVADLPRQERLRVQQAGASHLRLSGDFGTLKLEQAGACRTTATGHADDLDLSGAGACELSAANLQARRAEVSLAGVCKARVDVTERLKSSLVGASQVAYSGSTTDVKTSSVGASSAKRVK
jgi:phage shock protein PspC (stress-responsive transcriptional regulator)